MELIITSDERNMYMNFRLNKSTIIRMKEGENAPKLKTKPSKLVQNQNDICDLAGENFVPEGSIGSIIWSY